MTGYYNTATGTYDIKWTMPHCVLTLKLIGEWRVPSDTHAPPILPPTLSPLAASCAPSLRSTHTFSLCSGLAIDYYDGGKDQVSTLPPQRSEGV